MKKFAVIFLCFNSVFAFAGPQENEALIDAVIGNDLSEAKRLIERGAEVNYANPSGTTATHAAAYRGNSDILRYLTHRSDLNVNQMDNNDTTPLMVAAKNGKTDAVRILLNHPEIRVNSINVDNHSALYIAAWNGHSEIVRLLLWRPEISVNAADQYNQTPLFAAAIQGHVETVRLLLNHRDTNVNVNNSIGVSILNCDKKNNKAEINQILRNAGAQGGSSASGQNQTQQEKDALLVNAILQGNYEQAARAIELGANVNCKSSHGDPILVYAANFGKLELVKLLMNSPALQINSTTNGGQTALTSAAGGGYTEIVRLILSHPDVNVNQPNASGVTALSCVKDKNEETINQLLKNAGARIIRVYSEMSQAQKDTLLHNEIMADNYEEVVKIVNAGADVNFRDQNGYSIFVYAASLGQINTVRLLMSDPKIWINNTSAEGNTALILAASNGHTEIVRLLLTHPNINVNFVSPKGVTPLNVVKKKNTETINRLLINAGARRTYAQGGNKGVSASDALNAFNNGTTLVNNIGAVAGCCTIQ